MPATIPPVQIRRATVEDLPAINDIYNHYVVNSTCTYQEEPETLHERHAWFAAHGPAHPITVALLADDAVELTDRRDQLGERLLRLGVVDAAG